MSPFKHCKNTPFQKQSHVLVALLPIFLWGIYVFGTRIITLILISTFFSTITELSFFFLSKKKLPFSVLSPIITGILSSLILPVSAPVWCFILGGVIPSVIKIISINNISGLNIINPVATSGLILFGLFENVAYRFSVPFQTFSITQFSTPDTKYVTTILQSFKNQTDSITNSTLVNIFIGKDCGGIGEISSILIIIACFYLVYKNCISWHIPVFFTSTLFLLAFFFPSGNCEAIYYATTQIFSGSSMFAAVFVASLPTASPITKNGKIIFGIACGVITFILRRFTSISDGALFAVAIMSALSLILDNITGNKYFSYIYDAKKEKEPQKTDLESLLKDE